MNWDDVATLAEAAGYRVELVQLTHNTDLYSVRLCRRNQVMRTGLVDKEYATSAQAAQTLLRMLEAANADKPFAGFGLASTKAEGVHIVYDELEP